MAVDTNIDDVKQEEEFSDFCETLLFRKLNLLNSFTGSCFELPLICFVENVTDIDMIKYRKNIFAINKGATIPEDLRGTVLIINSETSYHGYARLYFKDSNAPYTYAMVPEERPARSQVLVEKSDTTAGSFPDSSNTRKWLDNFQGLSRDVVDAIWCPIWPEEAQEWITRERLNGWPLSTTLNRIVSSGCLLVAKPHQEDSQFRGNEWTFSFSEAELVLIHSWSDTQIYIYYILRLIKSDVVKKCGGKKMTAFATYHLKTFMFWACEEKPTEFWLPDNISTAVKELLIVTIEWLIKKQWLNYFMPGNNMIGHFPASHNFEREVQFLADSVPLVLRYISSTVPFTEDRGDDRFKRIYLRIPTNLLFSTQLRTNLCNVIDHHSPGRQRCIPSRAIKKSHLFRSDIALLFQCLTVHRRLISTEDLQEKLRGLHEIEECFSLANRKQFDGFTTVDISPMDKFHDLFKKVLPKTVAGTDSIELPVTVNHQKTLFSNMRSNTQRWELCYRRIGPMQRNHVASILEMFFNVMNDQMLKPTCFHTAAYEANFYWTILGNERSAAAVESYN